MRYVVLCVPMGVRMATGKLFFLGCMLLPMGASMGTSHFELLRVAYGGPRGCELINAKPEPNGTQDFGDFRVVSGWSWVGLAAFCLVLSDLGDGLRCFRCVLFHFCVVSGWSGVFFSSFVTQRGDALPVEFATFYIVFVSSLAV